MRPSCEYVTEWWEMASLQKIIAVVYPLCRNDTDGASLLLASMHLAGDDIVYRRLRSWPAFFY